MSHRAAPARFLAAVACTLVAGTASVSSLAATPAYRADLSAASPTLWYSFDEPSGVIVNHGSLGTAFNANAFGSVGRGISTPAADLGMRFDQGDFLESLGTSTLTGNPTFSVEAVIRLDPPAAGVANLWGPFLHWGDGGAFPSRNGREVYFGIQSSNNDRIYAGFYNAGVRTDSPVPTGRWIHVVWTRQGGGTSTAGSTLYVNGVVVNASQDPQLSPGLLSAAQIAVTATPFRVNAGRDFAGQRYFTGVLDELALFSRVLTSVEIGERARLFLCPADINADGFVDFGDVGAFVSAFAALQPAADLNADGVIDFGDVAAFVTAFNAGC